MASYVYGNGLISEEKFDIYIQQLKERDRRNYLEADCPLIDEHGKECPDARYLSTCGIGLCILRTEEEYDKEMAEYKERMKVEDKVAFYNQQRLSFRTVEYTNGCKEPKISCGYPDDLEYKGGFRPKVDTEEC